MSVESDEQKRTIQRWIRLAIHLNGAADSGNHDGITTDVVLKELEGGHIFDFLRRELPPDVWMVSKLTDGDRHTLTQQWEQMASAYEPAQFHVHRSGLSLLVAYLLHLIDIRHAIVQQ